MNVVTAKEYMEAVRRAEEAEAEVERLQHIIDSRPAINAGLPDSYIAWSQSIYVTEAKRAGAIPANDSLPN